MKSLGGTPLYICILIATPFMFWFASKWKKNTRATELNLCMRWMLAFVLGSVGLQVLYETGTAYGWDWSYLFFSYLVDLYPSILGTLGFVLLNFAFIGIPYLIVVWANNYAGLKHEAIFLRWLFFCGSFFLGNYLFVNFTALLGGEKFIYSLAGLGSALNKYIEGLPLVVILMIASLIFESRKIKRGVRSTAVTGLLAAIAAGYWILLETLNWWFVFPVAGLVLAWTSRLPKIIIQPQKVQRFFYWFLVDLPSLVVFIGSWMIWGTDWLTFLLTVLSVVIVSYGVFLYLMARVFPIVGRQELRDVFIQAGQPDRAKQIQREIDLLEADRSRKVVSRGLKQQQKQLHRAEQARRAGRTGLALPILNKLVADFSTLSSLSAEQKACLGETHQSRAKVYLATGSYREAEQDYQNTCRYIQPDEELLSALAEYAAAHDYRQPAAIQYSLEFLKIKRDRPAEPLQIKVYSHLERCCRIEFDTPDAQVESALQTAQEVKRLNPGLAWPYRVEGQHAFRAGKTKEAISLLQETLQKDPTDAIALNFLGEAHAVEAQYSEARSAFERSLKLNDQQPAAAHRLGVLLLERFDDTPDDIKSSIHWLQRAAQMDESKARYQYDLGRAYLVSEDRKKAREPLEKAVTLDAGMFEARRALADLLYEEKSWSEALPHYENIVANDRDDLALSCRLGTCYVETGQTQKALELLSPLAEEDEAVLLPVGRAQMRLGETETAMENLRAYAKKHKEDGAALYYLGCALARMGASKNPRLFEEAADKFKAVAALDGNYAAQASLQLGNVYLCQEKFKDAADCYQQAMKDPGIELAAGMGLVRAYLAGDQAEAAGKVMQRLNRAYGDHPQMVHLTGLVAEMQKDYKTAENAYRQANANGSLGAILYLSGKVDAATEYLEKARQEGDHSDRILYYSGLTMCSRGNYKEAVNMWDLLARRHPDDRRLALNVARIWYLWGCELYKQGEYVAAAEAWEKFFHVYAEDEDTRLALQQLYMLAARNTPDLVHKDKLLHRAVQLGASEYDCETLKAIGTLQSGEYKKAIEPLNKLVKKNPKDMRNLYNLGLASFIEGDLDTAVESLEKARKVCGVELKERCNWALLAAYAGSGKLAKAEKLLSELGM